jgi:serine-type D-Ala-D-Ala carboxypeptidase/endopeptidase (penicillin-binding protein 4)
MLAVAVAITLAPTAAAAPLAERLERALSAPGVSADATGAVAVSVPSGHVVFARNVDRALRPASNEKLVVAVAALQELGPHFRIPTRVYGEGERDGALWRGRLVLKGYGDPALGHDDLRRLARELSAAGIRRVTGGIEVDESFFDARRTAPGWRPSFYKEECPPLSALVVARAKVGRYTVDDPALAAAGAFRAALAAERIRVGRGTRHGTTDADADQLAAVGSPKIRALVAAMNRESDNFVAEMLLKGLGARELGSGTTAAGARVVRQVLRERDVPLAGVRIVDGSGLSLLNRLTARAVTSLLVSAASDPRTGNVFFGSLAVAGVNGTLEDRMERPPAYGQVRAKTGTTRNASALSGFVGTRYVFAILQNGDPMPYWHARRAQDRFAQVLAAN